MANRQAIRDLQTRLADRLQIARTQGVAPSWLALEAGGQKYLFPMSQAGEIFPWVAIHSVPYTQGWFLGVANLRGGLFGVVDLAGFVTGQTTMPKSELARKESRLIALNSVLDVNCALLIDRLSGLRNQEAFSDFAENQSTHRPFLAISTLIRLARPGRKSTCSCWRTKPIFWR